MDILKSPFFTDLFLIDSCFSNMFGCFWIKPFDMRSIFVEKVILKWQLVFLSNWLIKHKVD